VVGYFGIVYQRYVQQVWVMKIVRLFLLSIVSIATHLSAEQVVPYNDRSRIENQRYKFSSEDRLVGASPVVPEWPFFGRIFKTLSHGNIELQVISADEGFSPLGYVGNSAVYWFKKNPLQLRDICSLARLIEANQVIYTRDRIAGNLTRETIDFAYLSTLDHYLRYLAPHDLEFKASTQKQKLMIRGARSCWDDSCYVGFEIGLVRCAQDVAMITVLTSAEAITLSGKQDNVQATDSRLFKVYPDGLISIFNQLLSEKSFGLERNDQALLIGDTKIFINVPLKVDAFQVGSVSAFMVIPAPQQHNNKKIIQALVGDQYAGLAVGLSAGFSWHVTSLVNPHCFSSAQYSFPRVIARRVPRTLQRIVSSDTTPIVTGSDVALSLPLGASTIDYRAYAAFSTPDSTIVDFADQIVSMNMRRGPEVTVQLGNVFQNVLFKNLQLDASYCFKFKANDATGANNSDTGYDRELAVANSFSMSHVLSVVASYDQTDTVGFTAGLDYTFAGRHCLKEVGARIGIFGVF